MGQHFCAAAGLLTGGYRSSSKTPFSANSSNVSLKISMPHQLMAGSHGPYQWLTSDQENMNEILRQCPEVSLRRYAAITTYDDNEFRPTERDREAGWESRNGIAYSRQIRTPADLPECAKSEPAELYQEWYLFEAPVELGTISRGNVFVPPPGPGWTMAFISYRSLILHDPEKKELTDLFWRQLEALRPESYFGEGQDYLTFVTRNPAFFDSVLQRLKSLP